MPSKGFTHVLAVILIALILTVGAMFLLGPKDKSPKSLSGQRDQRQSGSSSSLESSKQYLKENGIDCTHENTYSTYRSLAIDPKSPNIIYVGIEGRGVYKSEDKGSSWRKIIKGIVVYPDSNDKSQLCFPDLSFIYIDPANTKRLLLITADITTAYIDWPYGETGGIWESKDGGENWKQIISGETNVAGSGSLLVDPKNPKVMYYPVNPDPPTFMEAPIKESLNKKSSVYKTEDGGKSWKEIDLPMLPGLQAMRVFIDPKDSNHLVFFTQSHDHKYNQRGVVQAEIFLHKQYAVLESFDGGKNWVALEEKLPAPYRALFEGDISQNDFNHWIVKPFLFGPEFPGDKTMQKSFYTTDGGKSFEETSLYIWVGRYNPHDKGGNHLLGYASENAKIVESKDAGETWEKISTPEVVANYKSKISNFVWDPKDPNIVYMSGDYGNVWQSFDGGKTWNNILNLDKLPN